MAVWEQVAMIIVGFAGALAAQLVLSRNFLDKKAEYELLMGQKSYLGKVVDDLNKKSANALKRVNELQDKIAEAKDTEVNKTESQYREALNWHLDRDKMLSSMITSASGQINSVHNALAQVKQWKTSTYVSRSALLVLMGGFFSWFVYYLKGGLGGGEALTVEIVLLCFVISFNWPVYFSSLGKTGKIDITAITKNEMDAVTKQFNEMLNMKKTDSPLPAPTK